MSRKDDYEPIGYRIRQDSDGRGYCAYLIWRKGESTIRLAYGKTSEKCAKKAEKNLRSDHDRWARGKEDDENPTVVYLYGDDLGKETVASEPTGIWKRYFKPLIDAFKGEN